MFRSRFSLLVLLGLMIPLMGAGRGPDQAFVADRDVFHFLLANHEQIERTVTLRADGVETLTESDDPEIAAKIKEHVAAMYRRVQTTTPLRQGDPLFVEIFKHTDKIDMKIDETTRGLRVIESSSDPYVASLIQEHAKVVSGFVRRGFDEAHTLHPVPGTALAEADTDDPSTVAGAACCMKKQGRSGSSSGQAMGCGSSASGMGPGNGARAGNGMHSGGCGGCGGGCAGGNGMGAKSECTADTPGNTCPDCGAQRPIR